MADDVGQDLEVKGSTYRIPKMEDVADAVVAFTDYSESIPYSEYIKMRVVADGGRAIEPVTKEDNGTMIVVQVDTTLQFGDLPEGFSVACVADSGVTITYQGVDKNGQQSTQYQVATVVTVGGLNILSLASPYDGEIGGEGGDGGGIALGTPPAPVLVDEDGNPDSSGGSLIHFEAGVPDADESPAIFYTAKIRRKDGAELTTENVVVDQENMEIAISGTTVLVDYFVDLFGINEEGRGKTSTTDSFQINYNEARGGVETTYVKDGKLWKQHLYTGGGGTYTLEVRASMKDWKVRLIGRGGAGAYGDCPMHWPTLGGRGGYYELDLSELPVHQELEVVIGKVHAETTGGYVSTPGTSSLEGVGKAGGGGNGFRTFYCYHGSQGDTGTWGGTSNGVNGGTHNGDCAGWARGGGGADIANAGLHTLWDGKTGNWGYHGSHGSCGDNPQVSVPGGDGLVAITYQIGDASKAQIAADEKRRQLISQSAEAGRQKGIYDAAFEKEEYNAAIGEYRQKMLEDYPELAEAVKKISLADEKFVSEVSKDV